MTASIGQGGALVRLARVGRCMIYVTTNVAWKGRRGSLSVLVLEVRLLLVGSAQDYVCNRFSLITPPPPNKRPGREFYY